MVMSHHDEEDYFVPLEDQRVFGAGIKRKRIAFVPASASGNDISSASSSSSSSSSIGSANTAGKSISDRYLSIVLGKSASQNPAAAAELAVSAEEDQTKESTHKAQGFMCPVCQQSVSAVDQSGIFDHETSVAHQVCLQHSHPPSHLDREHVGLRYLADYGWDPDSRMGLGASGEGIRVPIKPKEKHDTAGLGIDTKHDDDSTPVKRKVLAKKAPKIVKLNAKETRKVEEAKKKRAEKLRQVFYGEDLSQYLGPEA